MRRDGKWSIGFFNVGCRPDADGVFGCATAGAIDGGGVHATDEAGLFLWKQEVRGTVICGSRDECICQLESLGRPAEAVLVFLASGAGAEGFLSAVEWALPGVRLAGGVSACDESGAGELLPENGEAALLIFDEPGAETFCENILNDTGRRFAVRTEAHPRELASINSGEGVGRSALSVWRELQRGFGVPEQNFECLTLSDARGNNIHMHAEGKTLCSGANCRDGEKYSLRFASPAEIDEGAQRFSKRKNSLICGCAGLKSAMRRLPQVQDGSLAVFLFGEIAANGFANLMMTGIKLREK